MTRSSILTTGLSSRVVLVMNASSACSEIGREQRVVADLNSGSAADLEEKCAGDAFEQPGLRLWRQRNAVAHQEEVRL